MEAANDPSICPCGSGVAYASCCGRLHAGDHALATAEAMMRSRYSAYALHNAEYLLDSWHPDTRPSRVTFNATRRWLRLTILATERGRALDADGTVEYVADFEDHAGAQALHETSRFTREDGRWLYVEGSHH